MKTNIIIFLSLFLFINNYVSAQTPLTLVRFDEIGFEDAKGMAEGENKFILMKFTDAKKADILSISEKEVFNDEKFADLLNRTAVLSLYLYKGDKKQSKIIKKYNISKFPSYVFFDKDFNIRYKLTDNFTKNDFFAAVGYASSEEDNMIKWSEMIKNGEGNSDIYFKYAKALYLGGDDYRLAATEYFNHCNADFTKETNGVEAILLFTEDMYDPRFMLLARNLNSTDIQGLDRSYVNTRIIDIISNSLIQSIAAQKKDPADTINSTAEFFHIDNPALLQAKVLMSYYTYIQPDTNSYFAAMNDYILSGLFELNKQEIYKYIKEIADGCNDPEITRSATTVLLDMIAQNNLPEYQKLLIKLSLKSGDIEEAQHSYEILQKMNEKKKVVSPEELDALMQKIENAVKDKRKKGEEMKREKRR